MVCKNCGNVLSDESRFCPVCGATAVYGEETNNEMHCPACGAKQEPGSRYCGVCGAVLDGTQGNGGDDIELPTDIGNKKNNNNVLLIVVLAAIVVISGTVIGALLYINSNNGNTSDIDYNTMAGKTTAAPKGTAVPSANPSLNTTTQTPAATQAPAATQNNTNVSGNGDYLYPSDRQYITQSELDSMTPSEIRYILNEMYAKHGYIFQSEQYQRYFSGKSWYRGTTTSQDVALAYFNSYEIANRKTIVDYETAHGLR